MDSKFGQHIAILGGILLLFLIIHIFAWSTCSENLVNKLMSLANLFCIRNVQNMSKKNRGKNLFSKPLPRISLIISILSFIPPQQPARRQDGRWARGRASSWRSSYRSWHRTSLNWAHHHAHRRYRSADQDEPHDRTSRHT